MLKKSIIGLSLVLGISAISTQIVKADTYGTTYFSKTVPARMGVIETDIRQRANNGGNYMTFMGSSVGTTVNIAMVNNGCQQRSNRLTYAAGATDRQYCGVYSIVKSQGAGLWYHLHLNSSSSNYLGHQVSGYWSPNTD